MKHRKLTSKEQINEPKAWFLESINKSNKFLPRLIKKKGRITMIMN